MSTQRYLVPLISTSITSTVGDAGELIVNGTTEVDEGEIVFAFVKVLLVLSSGTTVLSTATVTAEDPSKDVPVNPVPIVRAFVVDAFTVVDPPSDTLNPLTVIVEFVSPEFGIVATLEITPAEVVVTYPAVPRGSVTVPVNVGEAFVASPDTDPPSGIAEPFILIEELVRLELAILEIVFDEPEIVLFVSVSLVPRPTSVSVDVGNVSVPVLLI